MERNNYDGYRFYSTSGPLQCALSSMFPVLKAAFHGTNTETDTDSPVTPTSFVRHARFPPREMAVSKCRCRCRGMRPLLNRAAGGHATADVTSMGRN